MPSCPNYEMISSQQPPLKNADWENLPPAVKRKYFSSLERLGLAQVTASKTKPSSLKSKRGTAKVIKPDTKPSRPPLSCRNSSYFKNPSILRKRHPRRQATRSPPLDAQWFLRLPDKVQREAFHAGRARSTVRKYGKRSS
ncbi:hypothetical protein ABVK25_009260 [Lepraria finkii]|uniref:Uncharacterized protein n=1 Tax=Lepraria finkii TaxID=1340010 RepID=A0ABR4AXP6_9LECA